jgi:cysteine synthase A
VSLCPCCPCVLFCALAGKVAKQLGPGHTVVTVLCDGAHRYMSRLFSKKWLETKGLYGAIPKECLDLVTLP